MSETSPSGTEVRAELAAVPFLLLPFDSITHLLGADLAATSQTLPATALFSLVYLVLRNGDLRTCAAARPVATLLGLVGAYLAAITLVNIAAESTLAIAADTAERLGVAFRQGTSFALGISTFFMFQDALLRIGWSRAARFCLLGAIPNLLLAAAQVATGLSRSQGFSSEPAHFADYLVLAVIPSVWAVSAAGWRRLVWLGACGAALLMTFSSTGFLKAAFALASFFAWQGKAVKGLVVMGAVIVLGYAVLALVPDNYVFMTVTSMHGAYSDTGEVGAGTFVDRFYGFWGPISFLGHDCSLVGCGFGGDTVYFHRMFTPEIAEIIASVKGNILSIASLQGKMLLYAGVGGYAAYLLAWWRAWRTAPRWHEARFMIPTLFASSVFSMGPFFLPYVWFWLAAAVCAAGDVTGKAPAHASLTPDDALGEPLPDVGGHR